MQYYVVLPSGERYGPATIDRLNEWAHEGRLLPDSVVEEVQTGTRFRADTVPGVQIPNFSRGAPPQYAPKPAPQQRPWSPPPDPAFDLPRQQPQGDWLPTLAWLCSLGGLALCCTSFGPWLGGVGFVLGAVGASRGSRSARGAMWMGLVTVALALSMGWLGNAVQRPA
jgi:hypothetical protein